MVSAKAVIAASFGCIPLVFILVLLVGLRGKERVRMFKQLKKTGWIGAALAWSRVGMHPIRELCSKTEAVINQG